MHITHKFIRAPARLVPTSYSRIIWIINRAVKFANLLEVASAIFDVSHGENHGKFQE